MIERAVGVVLAEVAAEKTGAGFVSQAGENNIPADPVRGTGGSFFGEVFGGLAHGGLWFVLVERNLARLDIG